MYLRQRDYDRIIQPQELVQYTNTDAGIQSLAYLTALAKIKSKLKQKFYVDFEFTDTNPFSFAGIYTGNNRIELNFPLFNASIINPVGAVASDSALNQYVCKIATTANTEFNPAEWFLIGTLYDIWYLQLPYPLFQINQKYNVGDPVFWKGNIYIAKQSTVNFTSDDVLQVPFQESHGGFQDPFQEDQFRNIFPDDPISGVKAWGNPIPYNVVATIPNAPIGFYTAWDAFAQLKGVLRSYNGVLYIANKNSTNVIPGTDPASWAPITWLLGDNRDQLCVDMLLKFVVWDIVSRIMIDEAPVVREKDKEGADRMLEGLALGEINEDKLVLFETGKGLTTKSGGATKNINIW